jgi:chromosome segregation ATPase
VQNLEYEHKNARRQVGAEGEHNISKERAMHADRVAGMNEEKAQLKRALRVDQEKGEDALFVMRQGFDKGYVRTRDIFEENHRKLQQNYEAEVLKLKEDLELRRKVEIHEIEERKNQHINELMFNHQEAFDNIKAYYNDITHDNLQLIRQLKDDINEMKEREKANQKRMDKLTQENKELSEPLAQQQQRQRELEEKLKYYEKDKMALKSLKAHQKHLEERIQEAKNEYRITEEKYRKVEREREDLNKRFSLAVGEIQWKAELGKNAVLEKKMEQLQGQYEEKQAQLTEVLSAAKLDPSVVASVTKKLEQVLGAKNRQIRDLHYQVHQATKAYNDTIRVYEVKLPDLGIDPEELGFEQIANATSTMPARLVTRVA